MIRNKIQKTLDREEGIVYAPRFVLEDPTLRGCNDFALDPVLAREVEG
jgi:hypothetical protein